MNDKVSTLKMLLSGLISPKNPRCAICKRVLIFEKDPVCHKCVDRLNRNSRVAESDEKPYPNELAFTDGVSLYCYDDLAKELIFEFKYQNNPDAAEYCGLLLSQKLKEQAWFSSIDLITYVPINQSTLNKRKYNQSEFIVRGIEQKCDIIIKRDILSKSDAVRDQTELDYHERFLNIKDAFTITDIVSINDKIVLIIDDVITTGATLHSISTVMLEAGAKKVYFATVATAYQHK